MPPKVSSASLTDREMEQLRIYHRCLKTKPEIDIEKFASLGGFGNIASARASIGRLLNKISNDQEASGADSPTKDAGDEGAAPATPASKKKTGGRKRKADAAETNDAEDESPTKKKASPTKRKGKAAAKAAIEEEDVPVRSEAGDSAGNMLEHRVAILAVPETH